VSFGDDINAIDAAIDGPTSVTLAPLPGLTQDELAGSENPQTYFAGIRDSFFSLKGSLADRRADYNAARAEVSNRRSQDVWLTAQMELSNISQATEAIKTIRAQLALVAGDVPDTAGFITAAEALELESREFIFDERQYLAQNRP